MADKKRKKTAKHMKPSVSGVKTSVQFDDQWLTIIVKVPRKRVTERLMGKNLRNLKRLDIGLDWIRNFKEG